MKKPLSELTIDELRSKQKTVKLSAGIFVGMMIVLVGSLIALLALKGARSIVISLSVMPMLLLPVLYASSKTLKDIAAEISSREK